MKIIQNNNPVPTPEYPRVIKCRKCGSKLEIVKEDLITGEMFYSQREIDYGVVGVMCPCCNNFSAL